MKKIIEKKIFNISITQCFDDETNKNYKLKDLRSGKLVNFVFTKLYSEDNYQITDFEVGAVMSKRKSGLK